MKMSNTIDGKSKTNSNESNRIPKKFRITIEPYMFIALFGLIMTYMTMQNLLLDKACRVDLELDGEYQRKGL